MSRILRFTIFAVILTAAAIPALAAGLTGAGLQIGWSTSPDDFLAGFHYNARALAEEVDLVPSIDFGFGDVTMISPNLDAHYVFKTGSKLRPYAGAGIAVPWYDFDSGSEWDFGGAIVGGVHVTPNMAFEVKAGLGDAPDWKFVFLLHNVDVADSGGRQQSSMLASQAAARRETSDSAKHPLTKCLEAGVECGRVEIELSHSFRLDDARFDSFAAHQLSWADVAPAACVSESSMCIPVATRGRDRAGMLLTPGSRSL